MQAEVKIRQLTQATVKDLKGKVKEKTAEIEVLKEMVKSANMQVKAKDTDIDRLKKRLSRKGGAASVEDTASNYGSRRGKDERSTSSRHSRLGQQRIDPGLGQNDFGMNGIPERDAFLEDTGHHDPNYIGGPQVNAA